MHYLLNLKKVLKYTLKFSLITSRPLKCNSDQFSSLTLGEKMRFFLLSLLFCISILSQVLDQETKFLFFEMKAVEFIDYITLVYFTFVATQIC